jgi:hypothetical protein
LLGYFNAHESEFDKLRGHGWIDLPILLHGADAWSNDRLGEFEHGAAEELFFFRQNGERGAREVGAAGHRADGVERWGIDLGKVLKIRPKWFLEGSALSAVAYG